ncbi:MAG: glycosyltransferase family 4 protein [Clostridiales bacterium]|nr:glycosyltransferase family 4 protein [Clostridiales bacterium]
MKKRILLISYYFAPENVIGAVRPTKLAKYLLRQGHEVTVICGDGQRGLDDPTLAKDLEAFTDVHVLREWNPLRDRYERKARTRQAAAPAGAAPAARSTGTKALVKRLIRAVANKVYIYLVVLSDRHFQYLACKELKKLSGHYDAVFSSFAPLSVHMVARKAKRMGLTDRWIADCRDEVNVPFFWMRPWMRWYMRMLHREADVQSGVSQGSLDTMGVVPEKGRVLYNGYDTEDLPAQAGEWKPNERFTLAYCGQLSMNRKGMGSRDLTEVFQALRLLIDEGTLTADELEIVYAGNEGAALRCQAAAAGLEERVTDHGVVSRERSLSLQRAADVLMVATWCTPGQKGILTGKLYECMLMKKPVVCTVQGSEPGSDMARLIRETEIGFCSEAATGGDVEGMADYLRSQVERWRRGESGIDAPKADRYRYQVLAQQLAEWIDR